MSVNTTSSKKRKRVDRERPLVAVANQRVVLNQPRLQLGKHAVVRQGLNRFLDLQAAQAAAATPYASLPRELDAMLALLVHESDKDLPRLVRAVQAELFPSISGGLDVSEESAEGRRLVPNSVLEARIGELADRVNYGIERDGQPVLHGALWRWEVRNLAGLGLPGDLVAKLEARRAERLTARRLLADMTLSWTPEQWAAFSAAGKRRRGVSAIDSSPVAAPPALNFSSAAFSGSSSPAPPDTNCTGTNDAVRVRRAAASPTPQPRSAAVDDGSPMQLELSSSPVPAPSSPVDGRARRDAEKRERARLRDEERQRREAARKEKRDAKELERRRRQDEARRREQAQPRMSAFFAPVKPALDAPGSSPPRLRVGEAEIAADAYFALFPPYFRRQNVVYAPVNQLARFSVGDGNERDAASAGLDADFARFVARSRHSRLSAEARSSAASNVKTEGVIAGNEALGENSRETAEDVARFKLVQFHENVRPPYWGTWTRASRAIGGRRPFCRDAAVFDYEYDSEAEWVEEEDDDGEDLRSDDDEEDEDEEEDDEELARPQGDDWLVPNGYLSDDERADAVDDADAAAAAAAAGAPLPPKARRSVGPLRPGVIGPCFAPALDAPPPGPAGAALAALPVVSLVPGRPHGIPIFDTQLFGGLTVPSSASSNKENRPALDAGVFRMPIAGASALAALSTLTGVPFAPASSKKPKKRAIVSTISFAEAQAGAVPPLPSAPAAAPAASPLGKPVGFSAASPH